MHDEQAAPEVANINPHEDALTEPQKQPVDMAGYDMDLDVLLPKPKHVRLGGSVYEVYPPKLKELMQLSRLAGELQTSTEADAEQKLGSMIQVLQGIMPGLKEDGVDINFTQVMALFRFVVQMANPAQNSALKSLGIEPTTQKKITVE